MDLVPIWTMGTALEGYPASRYFDADPYKTGDRVVWLCREGASFWAAVKGVDPVGAFHNRAGRSALEVFAEREPEAAEKIARSAPALYQACKAALRILLEVRDNLSVASETWRDSAAGPNTIPGEPKPREDLDVSVETQEGIEAVIEELRFALGRVGPQDQEAS